MTAVATVRDQETNRVSTSAVRSTNRESLQGFVTERT